MSRRRPVLFANVPPAPPGVGKRRWLRLWRPARHDLDTAVNDAGFVVEQTVLNFWLAERGGYGVACQETVKRRKDLAAVYLDASGETREGVECVEGVAALGRDPPDRCVWCLVDGRVVPVQCVEQWSVARDVRDARIAQWRREDAAREQASGAAQQVGR